MLAIWPKSAVLFIQCLNRERVSIPANASMALALSAHTLRVLLVSIVLVDVGAQNWVRIHLADIWHRLDICKPLLVLNAKVPIDPCAAQQF